MWFRLPTAVAQSDFHDLCGKSFLIERGAKSLIPDLASYTFNASFSPSSNIKTFSGNRAAARQ
jgi:hypothetical protein